jgi:peptide/nickel transport system substrate-binding protein
MAESGYKGEKVVMIATNEIQSLFAMANVTAEKLKQIGVNVDIQLSDWGGVVTRRAKKDDPYQGGWHIFHTTWGGLSMSHPLSNVAVNEQCGGNNWFGWGCDEEASALLDKFIRAPEPAQQKQLAEAYQKRLMEVQPLALTGQYNQPTFFRKSVHGLLKATVIVFWNVSKEG